MQTVIREHMLWQLWNVERLIGRTRSDVIRYAAPLAALIAVIGRTYLF
ncbi:MAG: hypothetical protein Harvfovirus27_23 [Harvfovirus sp.]|uniref:Uncharacterized protein n=1 Tax=Harvfovirus sp. TaxID=2487768 RepID=A0A3G5A4C9_9VIRU|nr:MAG: hypothetical protein Harvfovirus27_23 [Harvfovirus sp.]